MLLIKFGGSLISTQSDSAPRLCGADICAPLMGVLGRYLSAAERRHGPSELALIHGVGSYGKPQAQQYGYEQGYLSRQQQEIIRVVRRQLSLLALEMDHWFDHFQIPTWRMGLELTAELSAERTRNQNALPGFMDILKFGMVPLMSGDIVPADSGHMRVLSSDEILSSLASQFYAPRCVFLINTIGVHSPFDSNELMPTIDRNVLSDIRASTDYSKDVSGGIVGKLESAFSIVEADPNAEVIIIDGRTPDALEAYLNYGEIHGTKVLPVSENQHIEFLEKRCVE